MLNHLELAVPFAGRDFNAVFNTVTSKLAGQMMLCHLGEKCGRVNVQIGRNDKKTGLVAKATKPVQITQHSATTV